MTAKKREANDKEAMIERDLNRFTHYSHKRSTMMGENKVGSTIEMMEKLTIATMHRTDSGR